MEAGYIVRVGAIFPSYFINSKGCELIQKPFAELVRTLTVHYQSETCVALIRSAVDLEGVVEPEQLRKCHWYIGKMDARARNQHDQATLKPTKLFQRPAASTAGTGIR